MSDMIDIYDANLNHIGVRDRLQAHLDGCWHRTFHCWVVNPNNGGQLLFQKRADSMRNFPGLLDVSAAGHLDAGESVEDGVREVTEELGIPLDQGGLHYLGERVEVADQANGQRNREYQSVYMYACSLGLADYRPEPNEVAALVWLPIGKGMQLFTSSVRTLGLEGYAFQSDESTWSPNSIQITERSFLPRIQPYYLTALIMGERLLNRAGPLSVS